MYGCCGINCSKCECYQAMQGGDDFIRYEMATKWSAIYNARIQPSQINCHGCMSNDSTLSVFCADCEIRRCCRSKGLASCASCEKFPCEKSSARLGDAYAAEKYVTSFL